MNVLHMNCYNVCTCTCNVMYTLLVILPAFLHRNTVDLPTCSTHVRFVTKKRSLAVNHTAYNNFGREMVNLRRVM